MQTAAWLVLILPLAGSVLLGLLYRRLPGRTAGLIGTLAIGGAFVAAVVTFLGLQDRGEEHRQVLYVAWSYAQTAGVDA
jgi:NADH-quinone oxidoreductase subunit L